MEVKNSGRNISMNNSRAFFRHRNTPINTITKNGIPKAVIMSMEHYETMSETMAILGDKEMMEQYIKLIIRTKPSLSMQLDTAGISVRSLQS
jgi:PHD/YefM family antitoxin component YafN of YafNO toxin-antitoxin module